MTPPLLITEFGRAKIDNKGYYRITSRKEGNHNKLLHRLFFEKFHGSIPEGYIIHHKDGDKCNNCILNLELMSVRYHQNIHNMGNDILHRNISLARNNSGYRNVGISKRSIYCVSIEGLREKVLAKGLIWEQFEEATA